MSEEISPKVPKALKEGTFVFEGIQEGEGKTRRTIEFKPPLVVKYGIYEKNEISKEEQDFQDDSKLVGYTNYDFGLAMATSVDESNSLINGYGGLTKESEPIEVLRYSIIYDLFHAFCHDIKDPNYSHYHWAITGWLKDRVTVKDYAL